MRTDTDRLGWVNGTYITFTNPLTTGLLYVEVINNDTYALTAPSGGAQVAYGYPANRRLIVSNYSDSWYKTRYRGYNAYIQKSKCRILQTTVHSTIPERMGFILEKELDQTNSRYYDNATGAWCQYFTNWLMKAAYLPVDRIPSTGGTGFAIEQWCRTLGGIGTRFFFANAVDKAAIKTKYNIPGSNELLDAERNFSPQKGDLIYYLWDGDRGRYEDGEEIVVSHVDMVKDFDGTTITVIGGNRGSSIVSEGHYGKNNGQIVGYARPNYSI